MIASSPYDLVLYRLVRERALQATAERLCQWMRVGRVG